MKTFADECISRARNIDISPEQVEQLANRLKKAIDFLRSSQIYDSVGREADNLADELEAMQEKK